VPKHLIADLIAKHLSGRGVRRIYGVPGGDCNLDLIESANRAGIEFVLTRTETSAAIMASVEAELTGMPGVVMTTRGPGLANATNGVAYASLDRAPLVVIADQYEDRLGFVSHQRIDQAALLRPLTKGESRLDTVDPDAEMAALLDLATAQPPGPVYLEVTGPRVRTEVETATVSQQTIRSDGADAEENIAAAIQLIAQADRPIILVGLQARAPNAAAALRRLVARWGCPVLVTYKAKGVASDTDPHTIGCYIGGAAEAGLIRASDLILLYGFDPIEGPPVAWRYDQPLIELTEHAYPLDTIVPTVSIVGNIATTGDRLAAARTTIAWTPEELRIFKAEIRNCALVGRGGPIPPQAVVQAAIEAAPKNCRVTVDSGAHMLSVLHLWCSTEPNAMLVSRGLATMGFALPAAIASALAEPTRPVIAFTGDGGLMMCASELGTALQNRCKLVVVVFNDACLTLIRAKQRRRQMANAGVDFSPSDFASVARGFGCAAFRVERLDDLQPALVAALGADGPALVDVVVNPQAYDEQIIALRG
jgi:acetolactate synthase-1/2/3 large subunit